MKVVTVLLLSSLLVLGLAHDARALEVDDKPGNLFIFEWLGPGCLGCAQRLLCLQWLGFYPDVFTVVALTPEQPTNSVSFQVQLPPNLIVTNRTVVRSNARDVSAPGDDEWEIVFDECLEPGQYVELVSYSAFLVPGEMSWICLSAPDQPEPTWGLCSGGTISGGRFPVDTPPLLDGCIPVNPTFDCAVETPGRSWSSLKGRF